MHDHLSHLHERSSVWSNTERVGTDTAVGVAPAYVNGRAWWRVGGLGREAFHPPAVPTLTLVPPPVHHFFRVHRPGVGLDDVQDAARLEAGPKKKGRFFKF